MTAPKKVVTPELIARRNEQKRINDEKSKAFVPAAEKEFAALFGLPELGEIQKKALHEQIMAKARLLMFSAEKGTKVVKVRGTKAEKLRAKTVGMFARAFGYAIANKVDSQTWGQILDEASKNPIAPKFHVRKKKEEAQA